VEAVAVLVFPPIGTLELLPLQELRFIALVMLADPALEVLGTPAGSPNPDSVPSCMLFLVAVASKRFDIRDVFAFRRGNLSDD